MSEVNPEPSATVVCNSCGMALGPHDQFCGHCGKAVVYETISAARQDVFEILRPLLAYYCITLVILSVYKFTSLFPDGFEGMLLVSVIDMAVALTFWVLNVREVSPLFSFTGVRPSILLFTIIGAMLGGVVIHVVAGLIQVSISDDVFYNPYLFHDTAWPFAMATLFICVQPALFEEVAFRGFMFNNLQKLAPGMTTVYISSFIFGIIHLAIVSLLWLVPIGAAFAFLRLRYKTLWYGVAGHFVYNFTITVLEFAGI